MKNHTLKVVIKHAIQEKQTLRNLPNVQLISEILLGKDTQQRTSLSYS
jgi:hypothetical protein